MWKALKRIFLLNGFFFAYFTEERVIGNNSAEYIVLSSVFWSPIQSLTNFVEYQAFL